MGPKPKKRYKMANKPDPRATVAPPVIDPATDSEMSDAYGDTGDPEPVDGIPKKLHRQAVGYGGKRKY